MKTTAVDKLSAKDKKFFKQNAKEWMEMKEQEARVALMHEMLGYAQALANMKVIPEYNTVQVVFHFIELVRKELKGAEK